MINLEEEEAKICFIAPFTLVATALNEKEKKNAPVTLRFKSDALPTELTRFTDTNGGMTGTNSILF